ncbi:MAG: phosphoribosylformylglycinamidine synthase, partial [Pseudomonadota bacterium]
MPHTIETALRLDLPDPAGSKLKRRIASDLGLKVDGIRVSDMFVIDRELTEADLELLVSEVFRDPVIQDAAVDQPMNIPFDRLIEVGYRPGVTDNVGRTAREAVERTLGIKFGPGEGLYTRRMYYLTGPLAGGEAERIASDLLANDLIQTSRIYYSGEPRDRVTVPKVTSAAKAEVASIDLNVDDDRL